MENSYLDFEQPVIELERRIEDLRSISVNRDVNIDEEISRLEGKLAKLKKEVFNNLTPIQQVQLARHPLRPYTLDYFKGIFKDFIELHGDRNYRDDRAIVGGWALLEDEPVMLIGHQKGRDTKEKLFRNFGMPHPEGYRKALRLMKMAEKFGKPIITFLDTPGAYPGIEAEERGQGEAIARNLHEMAALKTAVLVVCIGEGGSGGALAIGLGDRLLMLENAIYSVCSPEACASILWRDPNQKDLAARLLKITASDLYNLGVVDEVIPEPEGGAHSNADEMMKILKEYLVRHLKELLEIEREKLPMLRVEKYAAIGDVIEDSKE
jgi:acetyl-CoA carboxylase carboxyl transferase subunit alpha